MARQQGVLFDERFLDKHAGTIITDTARSDCRTGLRTLGTLTALRRANYSGLTGQMARCFLSPTTARA